jgi:hypothetical protein
MVVPGSIPNMMRSCVKIMVSSFKFLAKNLESALQFGRFPLGRAIHFNLLFRPEGSGLHKRISVSIPNANSD